MDPKDQEVLQDELVEEIEELDEETLEEELVDDVEEGYDSKKKMAEDDDDDEEVEVEDEDEEDVKESFSEFDSLIDSEELALSEDFTSKAKLVFETALKSKVKAKTLELEENFETRLNEELESSKQELEEQVDSYLNYVVEQWVTDNKIAIETGLRAEVADSFMESLKNVFAEHYVEVPEGKLNLVDDLSEQVANLKKDSQAEIDKNIELAEELKVLKREKIFSAVSESLSVAQAEKMKELIEDVEYSNDEQFEKSLQTIKSSFFKEDVQHTSVEESLEESQDEVVELSPVMASYVSALKNANR